MRPISAKVKKQLLADIRMKRCAIEHLAEDLCEGRTEFHHVWIYAGRQVDEPWAILGGCSHHHGMVSKSRRVKQAFELVSLERATPADLAKYPRAEWYRLKVNLQRMFYGKNRA